MYKTRRDTVVYSVIVQIMIINYADIRSRFPPYPLVIRLITLSYSLERFWNKPLPKQDEGHTLKRRGVKREVYLSY